MDTIDLVRDAEYLSAERQRGYMRKRAGLEKETEPRLPTERQFLSLTQVCRQIRAEYRPSYDMETKVRVEYLDAGSYIEMFISPDGTDAEDARGNLVVVLLSSTVKYGEDIKDLICLSRVAPNVDITLDVQLNDAISHEELAVVRRHLYNLTHAQAVPKLHKFIQKSVDKLELSVEGDGQLWTMFHIKEGHGKDWMNRYTYLSDQSEHFWDVLEKFERWSRKMGVPYLPTEILVRAMEFYIYNDWAEEQKYNF